MKFEFPWQQQQQPPPPPHTHSSAILDDAGAWWCVVRGACGGGSILLFCVVSLTASAHKFMEINCVLRCAGAAAIDVVVVVVAVAAVVVLVSVPRWLLLLLISFSVWTLCLFDVSRVYCIVCCFRSACVVRSGACVCVYVPGFSLVFLFVLAKPIWMCDVHTHAHVICTVQARTHVRIRI